MGSLTYFGLVKSIDYAFLISYIISLVTSGLLRLPKAMGLSYFCISWETRLNCGLYKRGLARLIYEPI